MYPILLRLLLVLSISLVNITEALSLNSPINITGVHYDVRNGMIDSKIIDGEIDRNGGLWLVTARGLSHFDGQRFINFTATDPTYKIRGEIIKDILVHGDYVYVASDSIIQMININSKVVKNYDYIHNNRFINKIIANKDGNIFVLDDRGKLTDTISKIEVDIEMMSNIYLYVLDRINDRLYITTNISNKITAVDLSTLDVDDVWQYRRDYGDRSRGLVMSTKQGLINLLSSGTVAINTMNGFEERVISLPSDLTSYGEDLQDYDLLSTNFSSMMLVDSDGRYIPLNLLNFGEIIFKKIITDGKRTVFVFHDRGMTVFRVPPSFIQRLPTAGLSFSESNVLYKSIIETPDKKIIILMFKYILEYDPSTKHIKFMDAPVNFYVSGVLRGNVLFTVTDSKGLVEIDRNIPFWERSIPTGTGGKTEHAYAIYQDSGHLIIGYTNPFGLWKYDPSIRKHEQIPVLFDQHQGRDTAINHIIKDNDGYYWVSTNQGLYQFDQKWNVVQAYGDFVTDKGSNIPTNKINQVLIASDNTLWIATRNGLYKKDPIQHTLTAISDFSGDVIASIEEDAAGRIWLATYHGLMVYDPKIRQTLRYYQEDGLVDNEYNIGSHLKASDRSLYFGGLNGVVRIEPSKLKSDSLEPQLHLSSIVLENNRETRLLTKRDFLDDPIKLVGISDMLSIHVSFMEYVNPTYSKYRYRFAGLDDNWLTFENGALRLRNLPIGEYYIEIAGTHANGAQVEAPIRILVHVTEPFVRSTYFVVIVIVLVVGIVASILYYRYTQKMALRTIKTNLLNDMHDELGGILTKAAMKTQLVGSKHVIEQEDLNAIQQLHQEGIQSLRNLLWNISSEESTTQEFQDRITDWLTLVFEKTGIEFSFENRIPDTTFNLSVQQRRQLLPIIKELATNTLKHSNGGRFRLELDMVGGKYQIMALDDGKHVDTMFTETGYGIKSIKTRVENLNGVVSFSKTNKGFKTIILF